MRESVWKGGSKDHFGILLGETKTEMVRRADSLGWECHSGYSELKFPETTKGLGRKLDIQVGVLAEK